MSELFAAIYDSIFGIFDNRYNLIFQHLFDGGGYIKFGLTFIFIPLVFWFSFYILWRYPYGKLWHWLVWLTVTLIIVSGVTYGIANSEIFSSSNQVLNDALSDASTGYNDYASSLPLKYTLCNLFLTLFMGCVYSIIMKQFSKIQTHLPI